MSAGTDARKWSDRLAIATLLLAGGCASASQAVSASATATAADLAADVTNATVDAANTAWTWIWPFDEELGPDAQRVKMREQAGPDHFRNESFTDARAELLVQRSAFKEHRDALVSSEFVESRNRFRQGRAQPQAGLVIGPGVTDPDVIRALLAQAATAGVPVLVAQPVLAQLLPAFAAQQ